MNATTYASEKGARAAARKALGTDAEIDLHYVVNTVEEEGLARFVWEEVIHKGTVASNAVFPTVASIKAQGKQKITAKDTAKEAEELKAVEEIAEQHHAEVEAAVEAGKQKLNAMAFCVSQASMPAPVAAGARKAKAGTPRLKREERNGVKAPANMDGLCGQVWQACYKWLEEKGTPPTSKDIANMVETNGLDWNKNNASIEFYQWRKFNGINGYAKTLTGAA